MLGFKLNYVSEKGPSVSINEDFRVQVVSIVEPIIHAHPLKYSYLFCSTLWSKSHWRLNLYYYTGTVPLFFMSDHDDVIKWKHFPRYWPLCGEFTGDRWIPRKKPMTHSFDVFFDLCLNKWLSKQSRGWWFETPSRSLWRHCNATDWKMGFPVK